MSQFRDLLHCPQSFFEALPSQRWMWNKRSMEQWLKVEARLLLGVMQNNKSHFQQSTLVHVKYFDCGIELQKASSCYEMSTREANALHFKQHCLQTYKQWADDKGMPSCKFLPAGTLEACWTRTLIGLLAMLARDGTLGRGKLMRKAV